MSTQLVLGNEFQRQGKKFLVVRLINSQAVFQDAAGEVYLLHEEYAELKGEDESIEFEEISSFQRPFSKASLIAGLSPTIWRPKK